MRFSSRAFCSLVIKIVIEVTTGIVNTSNLGDKATRTARDLLHDDLNVNDLAPFIFSRLIIIIAIHTLQFLAECHR
jgi:hypothetical protein